MDAGLVRWQLLVQPSLNRLRFLSKLRAKKIYIYKLSSFPNINFQPLPGVGCAACNWKINYHNLFNSFHSPSDAAFYVDGEAHSWPPCISSSASGAERQLAEILSHSFYSQSGAEFRSSIHKERMVVCPF